MSNISKIILGIIVFFVLVVLYANEITWMNNTFDRNSMILTAVMLGVLVGLGAGYQLYRPEREQLETFQIFIGSIVVGALIMPLFLSLANRIASPNGIVPTNVEFVENDAFQSNRFGKIAQENPDGYHTFVIWKGEIKRIYSPVPIYENAQKGDTVTLPIKKGLLGYYIAYPERQ